MSDISFDLCIHRPSGKAADQQRKVIYTLNSLAEGPVPSDDIRGPLLVLYAVGCSHLLLDGKPPFLDSLPPTGSAVA